MNNNFRDRDAAADNDDDDDVYKLIIMIKN